MGLMRFEEISEQLTYLNEQNMTIIIHAWYNYNIKYLKILFSDKISTNQENCVRGS